MTRFLWLIKYFEERRGLIFKNIFTSLPGLALAVFVFVTPFAGSDKVTRQPFVACWQFSTDELSKNIIASDNHKQIFLPFLKGILQSIEIKTGAPLWKTELGGEITTNILFKNGIVFVAVKNAPEGSHSITVRALSSNTGIAIWETGFVAEKNEEFRLSAKGKDLYLISTKGALYSLDGKTGRINFSLDLKNSIDLPPTNSEIKRDLILISSASSGAKMTRYSADSGVALVSANIRNGSRILISEDDVFLTGDRLGNVSLYLKERLKRLWTIRTGAEVGDVVATARGFMLSSKDNFVYFVSREKGRRIWKVRLSKSAVGTLFDSENGVFSFPGGQESVFIETGEGRIVNRIKLEENNFFISDPIVRGEFFIAPTATGIFGYSQSACYTKDARQ